MNKVKKIFYKIFNPQYLKIKSLEWKVSTILKINEELLKKCNINATDNKSFYEKCEELFTLKDSDKNFKIDLCQKFLSMAQEDIVKNMCDYIIRSKPFLIFDIGANKGEVSKIILDNVNTKKSFIFAYEPIIEMSTYLELLKVQYANFDYKMIGIGNRLDSLLLKFNPAIDGLTSFLQLKDDYRYFACNTKDTRMQQDLYKVPIKRLDDEYYENIQLQQYTNIAIKIDVQGFEKFVLDGCTKLFENNLIKAVLIECTTVQKYQSASTYQEIFKFFHARDFIIFDMLPVYREVNSIFHQDNKGFLTEFDVVFVQKEFLKNNRV